MQNKEKIKKLINNQIFKSDEYITKLCYANTGFLNIGNIWCFDYAIANLPSENPIIEIGSFCGLSSNVITYLKYRHSRKNKLICVDPWDFSEGDKSAKLAEHPYLTNGKYEEIIKKSFRENILLFSSYDLPFPLQLRSEDFFKHWEKQVILTDIFKNKVELGGKISFAYIDGNHDYEFVKNDFEGVSRNLEIGGFILFDDSAEDSGWGVNKLAREICENSQYRG